ncbi:MAG TPA: shikimate kinase [Candidatus Limnocylindria bacterium]|nr:shikimate kinase [Candidatus Limnocylindria bacterium]
MMGSGKTTIGHLLADRTGWPYVDNDELVRRRSGMTARELLADGGQDRLRAVESAALELGLELPPPVIVGVAAGTVLDPRNRERMRDGGIVVWLRASAETLIQRAGDAVHRPFIDRDDEWMAKAAAEREPLYAEVADVVVDTGHAAPDESVDVIQSSIRSTEGCRDA